MCNSGLTKWGRKQDVVSCRSAFHPTFLLLRVNCITFQAEKRVKTKWIHRESGRTYNSATKKPQSYVGRESEAPDVRNMRDDITGEGLLQRKCRRILLTSFF